jgi:acyl-CoA thioesterase II
VDNSDVSASAPAPDSAPFGDETSLLGTVNRTPLAERIALRSTGQRLIGSPVAGFDQRVFGGHLLAQLVLAAGVHAPEDRAVESMHVYFLRPGRPGEPIDYQVRTVRHGRNRLVLAVSAEQGDRELLTGLVALGDGDGDPVADVVPPVVPDPESLPTLPERRARGLTLGGVRLPPSGDWRTASRPLDVRPITDETGSLRCLWLRAESVSRADTHVERAVLAFASDRSLLPVLTRARGEHPDLHRPMASADHAMWFHAEPKAGNWYLYAQDCPSVGTVGGLARGTVFDREGRVVASVAQHGVLL